MTVPQPHPLINLSNCVSNSYSLGWKRWCRLWSEHQHQSRLPSSLLIQAGIQPPRDSRPWGRSGPQAQQTCAAAWAWTSEHQDRERTSEATGQAPEVEAHIWAGISADREIRALKPHLTTGKKNKKEMWCNIYLRICRGSVCVRRCLRRHLHSRRVYRSGALLRVHRLLWIWAWKTTFYLEPMVVPYSYQWPIGIVKVY